MLFNAVKRWYNYIRHLPESEVEKLMLYARRKTYAVFGRKVYFYTPAFIRYECSIHKPSRSFYAISITGDKCELMCDHCRAKILKSMKSASSPDKLKKLLLKIKEKSGRSCLISGGSTRKGKVPLDDFYDIIKWAKKELKLELSAHVGLVEETDVKKLKESGIDAALIDVIGSDDTIEEVCHLKATVNDYKKSLELLLKYGVPTVPHVVIGLHYGEIIGELKAIELILSHKPKAFVFVVLRPEKGTSMERIHPPNLRDVISLMLTTRIIEPNTPLVLGCARPLGDYGHELQIYALKCGFNAIAFPAEECIEHANRLKIDFEFIDECCWRIYKDVNRWELEALSEYFS